MRKDTRGATPLDTVAWENKQTPESRDSDPALHLDQAVAALTGWGTSRPEPSVSLTHCGVPGGRAGSPEKGKGVVDRLGLGVGNGIQASSALR